MNKVLSTKIQYFIGFFKNYLFLSRYNIIFLKQLNYQGRIPYIVPIHMCHVAASTHHLKLSLSIAAPMTHTSKIASSAARITNEPKYIVKSLIFLCKNFFILV